jgi:chondroitin AC lyase
VRPGKVAADILKDSVKLMTKTKDMPRAEEVSAYYKELCGEERPNGTKYFEVAHFLSHKTGGIHIGARFMDKTLRSAEICNNENVLGLNQAYGTSTCIMKRGTEYYDLSPVWDYSRIPGTTSRTETEEEIRQNKSWHEFVLDSDIAGGVQNGDRAVVYELCQHDGIEALCADFAFEGGYLRLGTGIRDTTDKKEALVTTIDQRRIFGEMFEADYAFYVDGICYMSLDGKDIVDREEKSTGNWQKNNLFFADTTEVTEELLTLEIHHKAGEESSYAYLICEEDNEPEVEVLRNDKKAQGIRLPDGSIMAVVYEKTELFEDGKVYERGIVIDKAK